MNEWNSFVKTALKQVFNCRLCQDLLRVQAARWFVMLLVGILTALVASCIDIAVSELSKVKFGLIHRRIHFIVIVIETPGFAWRKPKTARPRYSKKLVKNDNVTSVTVPIGLLLKQMRL